MIYDLFMAPLELLVLKKIRKEIIPLAKGIILEIGFGTGVNLPYYNFNQINEFHALDKKHISKQLPNLIYHQATAENLDFENESFDTVVISLALCTITPQKKAISEIYRVLKPNGVLIFLEHQQTSNPKLQPLFNKINPYWKKMTSGCQINLDTTHNLMVNGFDLSNHKKGVFHYGIGKKQEFIL